MYSDFYKDAIDQATIVSVLDEDGYITYANENFCKISGFTNDEILDHKHKLVRTELNSKFFIKNLWETVQDKKVWNGNICGSTKKGGFFWLSSVIIPYPQINKNRSNQYLAIQHEISASKKSEELLRYNFNIQNTVHEILNLTLKPMSLKEKLNECLELILSISWLPIIPNGGIFLKKEKQNVLELIVHKNLPLDLLDKCASIKPGQCLCGKTLKQNETAFQNNINEHYCDNNNINSHAHYNIPIIVNNNVQGALVIYLSENHLSNSNEIESLKIIADTIANLMVSNQFLEEKYQAEKTASFKSIFLANMSHEIRTPLNSILGYIQVIEQTILSSEQQTYLNNIKTAGDHLMKLVNDILDISKFEANELILEDISFNLYELSEKIYRIFKEEIKSKNLKFIFKVPNCRSINFIGDPNRISQILINIIGNAIKFTISGEISLEVNYKQIYSDDYKISFTIKDTGIGIQKEHITNIFNNFAQADSSVARKFGGTGLGLSICKKLVTMMKGEIDIESKPNSGTTFVITLPLKATKSRLKNSKTTSFDEDTFFEKFKTKRILLAEDSLDNINLLQIFFKKMETSLSITHDGLEVIEAFKINKPNIILMDIQMPVIDGYTAIETIRRIEKETHYEQIPIIALTAHASKEEKHKVLTCGANMHITKPIKKIDLFMAIEKLLT